MGTIYLPPCLLLKWGVVNYSVGSLPVAGGEGGREGGSEGWMEGEGGGWERERLVEGLGFMFQA